MENSRQLWRKIAITGAILLFVAPLVRSTPLGPAIGIALLAGSAAFIATRASRGQQPILYLLGIAFFARVVLIAVDIQMGLFPKVDAVDYHLRTAALAETWWDGSSWDATTGLKTASYEVFVAPFYFWFGASPVLARVLNAVVSTAAIFNIFRIGRHLFDRETGLYGALAFALVPTVARVHGEHLREAIILLVLTQLIYLLLTERYRQPTGFALFSASLIYLSFLRQPTVLLLLSLVALVAILGSSGERISIRGTWDRFRRNWKAPILLALGLAIAVASYRMWTDAAFWYQPHLSPEGIELLREGWTAGGSAYLSGVEFHTWWDVIGFIPQGALYFLFTPFFGQVQGVLGVAALMENLLIMYPIAILSVLGMYRGGLQNHRVLLILFLAAASAAYGLIEGNVGTAIRHRAQFTWVLFIFGGSIAAPYIQGLGGLQALGPGGWGETIRRGKPSQPTAQTGAEPAMSGQRHEPDGHRVLDQSQPFEGNRGLLTVLVPTLHGGGAERNMVILANTFRSRGFDVDLVVFSTEGPYLDEVDPRVNLIDLGAGRAIRSLAPMVAYLRQREPTALLSTLPNANIIAVAANMIARRGTRIVLREANTLSVRTEHASSIRGRLVPYAMRIFYPMADAIVGVSDGVSRDLQESLGLAQDAIHTVHNPVVTDHLTQQAAARPEDPWFQSVGPPVVLGVGSLTPQKDFETLIRAFAQVRRRQDARLVILGEGPERESLEALARNLGISGDVRFLGFVSNPFAYMARCNVFVLSSRWEGLPNVLLQAMAVGAPVVSTDCPSGPNEILQGGKLAPLVPPRDPQALAEAILQTLQRHPSTDALVDRAQDFTADAIADRYLSVLEPNWDRHPPDKGGPTSHTQIHGA